MDCSESDDSDSEDSSYIPTEVQKIQSKEKFFSPDLSAALDRTNVSDRNATYILAAMASALGKNLDEIVLIRETIRKNRKTFREEATKKIKNSFKSSNTSLTVHWDGKLCSDLSGSDKVERTAILVTGKGIEKL